MRCLSLSSLYASSLVLLAEAAPAALPLPSSLSPTLSPFSNTEIETDSALASALPLVTYEQAEFPALIPVPCQACDQSSGADSLVLFAVDLVQPAPSQCDVVLTVNGTAVHLSAASPSAPLTLTDADSSTYRLVPELDCSPSPATGLYTAAVRVRITELTRRPLSFSLGFTVDNRPNPQTLPVRIFQEVSRGKLSAIVQAAPFNLDELDDSVAAFLFNVRALQDSLDRASSRPDLPANHTSTCPIALSELTCIARKLGQHVKDTCYYLFDQVKSAITNQEPAPYSLDSQQRMQVSMPSNDEKATLGEKETYRMLAEAVVVNATKEAAQTSQHKQKSRTTAQSPLAIALEAFIAFVGLGGVLVFIRQRCCSLRRRVERLADREERLKQREYARAARQEAWRRRWRKLRKTCTCCFAGADDDEDAEKAALMSHAASPGTNDDDMVEVSAADNPAAQLNGMNYAHDIVAEMMRARSSRASRGATSRASSLPSYDSDILPDYSSQPSSTDLERGLGSRIADGFPPRHSSHRRGRHLVFAKRAPSPGAVSSNGSSGCTPDSSIPEISPRPSTETLRTASARAL